LAIKSQNHGGERDHGFLWIKNALVCGVHTNEEIEWFVNLHISCDLSLLSNPLQKNQQHQHTYM
jgi:hypothetical protein